MKVRQDAWSHEDDVLLAETVLTHIKEGSTQLRAFDEVGDLLNRTSAACGFRWNAVVRKKHLQNIELAKRERKERKRAQTTHFFSQPRRQETRQPVSRFFQMDHEQAHTPTNVTLASIIQQLQQYATTEQQHTGLLQENEQLRNELRQSQQRLQELETSLQKHKQDHSMIEEDYQSLIQIMNRARRMAILEDEQTDSATFRMEPNGNLEKLSN
ncbi:RsfA family transcriptional regulator [Shouchella lonarensis]|uniref:Prespore-specific regulator n=1 Tax=Shouchella lonarensis TaxID=1464122 RepID=A0A1G6JM88_9BACI|nr:RsfA family transcriptional regulator [Shouchella lonarensis]SDC19869.1 prespore-specific regulator [Shouchella lonarensis]